MNKDLEITIRIPTEVLEQTAKDIFDKQFTKHGYGNNNGTAYAMLYKLISTKAEETVKGAAVQNYVQELINDFCSKHLVNIVEEIAKNALHHMIKQELNKYRKAGTLGKLVLDIVNEYKDIEPEEEQK